MQSEVESMKESLGDAGMAIEVTGEGNKLIYTYTFDQAVDVDTVKEPLADSLESQASTFEQVAESLKEAVDVENPVVVVEYLNPDGSEIYSQQFTAPQN